MIVWFSVFEQAYKIKSKGEIEIRGLKLIFIPLFYRKQTSLDDKIRS